MRLLLGFCSLVLCVLQPGAAEAHQTASSRMEVLLRPADREVDVMLLVPARDLGDTLGIDTDGSQDLSEAELRAASARVSRYLAEAVDIRPLRGKPCRPTGTGFVRRASPPSHVLWMDTFTCPDLSGTVLVSNRALFETGSYRHLTRIQVGERVESTVLSPDTPTYSVEVEGTALEPAALLSTIGRFLVEGVRHILLGIDHVLFVVCLILGEQRFRRLLYVITAFTVGHTTTLVMSALDVVTVSPSIVEPIIAATIVFVAVDNLVRSDVHRLRWAVAVLFGLVHGFGFSYVLREELRLPTGALLPALFSFNLGVEVGQVVVVASVWPLVRWVRGQRWSLGAIRAVSLLVAVVGGYWIVQRTLLS